MMPDGKEGPQYPNLDDIEVPPKVLENWQATLDLLAEIADIPAALIMRVHAREIEVCLCSHSPGNAYQPGEKALLDMGLYCETVMSTRRKLLVPDALKDPDWEHNPDMSLGMISYCGLPLTWPSGEIFGTICILASKPSAFDPRTHHLIEHFHDNIQLSLAGVYAASLARMQMDEAKRELRTSEARSQRYLDTTHSMMVALDDTGCVTMINRAGQILLGYPEEQLMGRNWFTTCLPQPDGLDREYPMFQRMMGGDLAENAEQENTVLCRDGRRRLIGWRNTYLRDDQNRIVGLLSSGEDLTERKRTEEVVRENEHVLEVLLDHIPNMLFVKDAQTLRFLRFNTVGEQLLGYSRHELLGKNDYDFFPKEQADFFTAKDREIIDSRDLLDIPEEPIETRYLGHRLLHTRKVPIYANDGTPLYLLGISEDITERRQAAEALQKSETLLNATQRLSKVGGWEFDVKSGRSFWTEELYRIHEIASDPGIDHVKESLACYRPEDRQMLNNAFQRACEQGESYDLELPFTTCTGKPLWIRTTAQPVFEEGKVVRLIGNLMDITERRQVQDAAAREQERLKFVFDALPVGICLIRRSADGSEVRMINDAHLRIAGLRREQDKAEIWVHLTHPGDRDRQKVFTTRMEQGILKQFTMDKRYVRPDGKTVWVMFSVQRRQLGGGEHEDLCTVVDITERKEGEDRLRSAVARLNDAQRIVHLGDWQLDLVTNELTWSDEIYRIFEIDPGEFEATYEAFLDAVHPDDRGLVNQAYAESVKNKMPYEIEHRLRMPDGRIKYVIEKCETNYDGNGMPVRSIGTVHDVTERKQAQEKIAHLASIVESSDDAIIGKALDGTILSWNRGAERVYGYTASEIVGCSVSMLVPPKLKSELAEIVARLKRGEKMEHHETVRMRKNGETIHVSMTISPIKDVHGRVVAASNITRDITARVRAEAEIHRLADLQQAILNNAAYMVISADDEGIITSFNPAAERALGYTAEDLVGKQTPAVFHDPDEVAERARIFSKELGITIKPGFEVFVARARRNLPNEYEWIYIRKDGHRFPVLLSVTALRDSQGTIDGFLGMATDISERKQAEEKVRQLNAELEQRVQDRTRQLAASEERMRLFFERQLVGMAITSPEKGWVEVNDKICELLGYSREELARLTWAELTYPDDLAADTIQFERMLKGEIESYMLEKRFIRKDGSLVFTTLAVGCVRRPDRSVDYVLALLEDITDRKQAEESINELNVELRQRAQALEAVNKELEGFAYSIAHDLRAPLRHLDGFVELLVSHCSEELSAQARHYVDTIGHSARKMGMLIDDLLAFSRTSRAVMKREKVNMNDTVQDVLSQLKESCSGRSIEWIIGDLPSVQGDPAPLRQVWVNLLGNAVKYTLPREAARIEVSAHEENDEIVFAVADNGVGFDMHYAGKLFGVFQRLHSEGEFEGTGIGLATVHRIITRHGGRIWAEAEVDRGATFYFTLPGYQQENP